MSKEDKQLLRNILKEQTIDQLVKQGFSRVQAELIINKEDINEDESKKAKKAKKEKKEKSPKEVIKRLSKRIAKR